MAGHNRQPEPEEPNHASATEPAEGSRENLNVESGETRAGISNRAAEEERERQSRVPPRGTGSTE